MPAVPAVLAAVALAAGVAADGESSAAVVQRGGGPLAGQQVFK